MGLLGSMDGASLLGAARRRLRLGAVLMVLTALGGDPLAAQSTPSTSQAFTHQGQEAKRVLVASDPRFKKLSEQTQQSLFEFTVGNMLYVSTHELGHGVLAELELPNLGRDEDAADAFAILTGIQIGSKMSQRVLVEGAKGWYFTERKRKKSGESLAYYDEHGLNLQRAYQIVCFMVGSDPETFGQLAKIAKLPEDRQESCGRDFRAASWSWDTLLKPHRRAEAQPKQQIEVTYAEGKGKLGAYARAFREIRFLERLAEHAADSFAWPRPFVMVMETCGESGASWRARKLTICYELAKEFADLYYEFGRQQKVSERKERR